MTTTNSTEGLSVPGIMPNKIDRRSMVIAGLFIVLGTAAIVEPGVASVAATILVAWLLIFGGVTHLIGAFSGQGWGRAIWQVLLGILYIAGGIYFRMHYLLALGTLTLLLAWILIAEAIIGFIAYARAPREERSSWMLVNCVATLLLGALIRLHWPSSSVWAIGTLVGVKLLITGFTRLMLGMAVRRLASQREVQIKELLA